MGRVLQTKLGEGRTKATRQVAAAQATHLSIAVTFLAGEGLNVERVCAYGKTEEPDFKLCEEGMNAYE